MRRYDQRSTIDFTQNREALGRIVARRQAQIREGEFRPDPHHPGWMVRGEAPPGTPPEPLFSEEFLTLLEKVGGHRRDFLDVNSIPGGIGDNVGRVATESGASLLNDGVSPRCNCGDITISPSAISYRVVDTGEIHYHVGTPCMRRAPLKVDPSTERSFFARRPDEKGRRRKKRDNPPPPMSDLLGEVPCG